MSTPTRPRSIATTTRRVSYSTTREGHAAPAPRGRPQQRRGQADRLPAESGCFAYFVRDRGPRSWRPGLNCGFAPPIGLEPITLRVDLDAVGERRLAMNAQVTDQRGLWTTLVHAGVRGVFVVRKLVVTAATGAIRKHERHSCRRAVERAANSGGRGQPRAAVQQCSTPLLSSTSHTLAPPCPHWALRLPEPTCHRLDSSSMQLKSMLRAKRPLLNNDRSPDPRFVRPGFCSYGHAHDDRPLKVMVEDRSMRGRGLVRLEATRFCL